MTEGELARLIRLQKLATLADELWAIELERIDTLAAEDAKRQRRQVSMARDYDLGHPVATIAAKHGCSMSYTTACAKRWGVPLRLAGAKWTRAA